MEKKTYNPIELAAKCDCNPCNINSLTFQSPADLADHAQEVANRTVAQGIDLTQGYDNWRNIGFALADGLGEAGRAIYHQLSRLNSQYAPNDCDKQYDACLRSHGSGVTMATFFYLAKQAGVDIHRIPPIAHEVELVELVENEDCIMNLKTFSDKISDNVSPLMAEIVKLGRDPRESDMLTFAALVVVSCAISKVIGRYDQRKVYANLFGYVVAPAASSKGMLVSSTKLVAGIDNGIRAQSQAEHDEWEHQMTIYQTSSKKNADMPRPKEPPYRTLRIPANGSSTATYQALNDNHGWGLTFETEGDTVANSLKSDYGDYSDGLRAAAHHEPIQYNRRKENEHVYIPEPRWSVFVTSTPDQLNRVFTSAENGLFSRFLFLRIPRNLDWHDVFAQQERTLDEMMEELGHRVHDLYQRLEQRRTPITFSLTKAQQRRFNQYFSQEQQDFFQMLGDDIVATVRRLGLSAFRIMMILSATRLESAQELPNELVCLDQDFEAAMAIIEVLMDHAAHVYADHIQKSDSQDDGAQQLSPQEANLLKALPHQFDRSTYQKVGKTISNSEKRVDNLVGKLYKKHLIEKVSHGHYRKISTQVGAE